jgi:hypothetical protein
MAHSQSGNEAVNLFLSGTDSYGNASIMPQKRGKGALESGTAQERFLNNAPEIRQMRHTQEINRYLKKGFKRIIPYKI